MVIHLRTLQPCQTLGDSRVWWHHSVVFRTMGTCVYFSFDLALARLGPGGSAQLWVVCLLFPFNLSDSG